MASSHEGFFNSKYENVHDMLPHLVHADHIEELGAENVAKHIRDAVEKEVTHKNSEDRYKDEQHIRHDYHYLEYRDMPKITTFKVKHYTSDAGKDHYIALFHATPDLTKRNETEPLSEHNLTDKQKYIIYYKFFKKDKKAATEHYNTLKKELENYLNEK